MATTESNATIHTCDNVKCGTRVAAFDGNLPKGFHLDVTEATSDTEYERRPEVYACKAACIRPAVTGRSRGDGVKKGNGDDQGDDQGDDMATLGDPGSDDGDPLFAES